MCVREWVEETASWKVFEIQERAYISLRYSFWYPSCRRQELWKGSRAWKLGPLQLYCSDVERVAKVVEKWKSLKLLPDKKAQSTQVEDVRKVTQLYALGMDPDSVELINNQDQHRQRQNCPVLREQSIVAYVGGVCTQLIILITRICRNFHLIFMFT